MPHRRRLPDPPVALIHETRDLLATLETTVDSLREFTERLRAATEPEETDDRP